MIKIKDFHFKRRSNLILKNIEFSAEKGQIISLLGPNGAGKLKCILNLLKVEKNKIFVNKNPLENYSKKLLSKYIAFLPQTQENIGDISVYELIALGRSDSWIQTKEDKAKIAKSIKYMSLEHKINEKITNLSGGERQKVFIAMALVRDTPVIIMDEPVTYMDIRNQWELLKIMKDLRDDMNKTIITVFHDINHALEVSDIIYLLKKGEIYKRGKPFEVITKENLKAVYNINTSIHSRTCKIKKCKKFSVIPIEVED